VVCGCSKAFSVVYLDQIVQNKLQLSLNRGIVSDGSKGFHNVTPVSDIHALHLPTVAIPTTDTPSTAAGTGKQLRPSARKNLRLSDLRAGETGRVLRVATVDPGCRKRFAELGLAEGMKVTVRTTGDVLMLALGGGAGGNGGSRMGLAARCADEIFVSRIPSK
jgi:hypothetical protein